MPERHSAPFLGPVLLLQLRRLLRQKAVAVCLALLVVLSLILGLLLPAQADSAYVKIGFLLPEDSPHAETLWQTLERYADEQVALVRATSFDEMERMVAGRVWELGYAFSDELEERIEAGNYARLVTRVVSPATVNLYMSWAVSAALLEVCAPDIAARFLRENDLMPDWSEAEWRALAAQYFGPDSLMDVEVQSFSSGQTYDGGATLFTGGLILRGVTALLLLVLSLLCAVRFSHDRAEGFFTRMRPYVHPAKLYFTAFAAAALLTLAAGSAALAIGGVFFPGAFAPLWLEAARLLLYLIYLSAFSYCLSMLFWGRETLVAALPFLVVACLLFCPILFDLGRYMDAARYISLLLPPTLYLQAANGNAAAHWQMLLAAGLWLGLGLLASLPRRRHLPA